MIVKFGKNTKLSTQFAIMTISLICLVVLITAGYTILFTKDLTNQISYQTTNSNTIIIAPYLSQSFDELFVGHIQHSHSLSAYHVAVM